MDVVTYAILKGDIKAVDTKVSGLADGFDYQGSVATADDLPASAEQGQMYTVTADGNAKYVYDGTEWIMVDTITTNQIDAFYT